MKIELLIDKARNVFCKYKQNNVLGLVPESKAEETYFVAGYIAGNNDSRDAILSTMSKNGNEFLKKQLEEKTGLKHFEFLELDD